MTGIDRDKRVAFFFEHAGYSYPSGADEATRLIARHDNALGLARAEEMASSRGWYVDVADDFDDCTDPDDDGEAARMLASGELIRLGVILKEEVSDRHLASLWGVIVPSDSDPYIRVIAAELASELLATHEECHARTTCGACGHAWCGICDPAPSALCHWCHGRGSSDAEMPAVYSAG